MIVHKILLGQGAGKHLPFAMARLAELQRISPTGVFTQRYFIEGFQITVQQLSNTRHIWIVGFGEVYFEFQTSGWPVEFWTYSQGGISGEAYKVGVVGVSISKGVATAKLLGGTRVEYPGAIAVSRIARQNQVQLLDEPVHYYSATANTNATQHYPRMLYDAWAPLHPHTGVHFRSYHSFWQIITSHTLLGSYSSHFLRDIGYDVTWNDNTNFNPLRGADLLDPADWARKAGIQLVTSESFGSREFAIYIDAFDQVSVFPTSQIGPVQSSGGSPLQNVDSAYVKSTRVTFPSWVYKKAQTFKSWYEATVSGGDPFEFTGLHAFPEYDWRVHPDGTKMCTVVYEHEPAVFDEAYFSPYETDTGTQGPGTYWPDQTSFDVMNAYTMGVNSLSSGAQTPGSTFYTSAPGLVEVSITITLTGPNPEDFSLDLVCTEIRRPTTSQYCTFLAGYCWYDIKDPTWTEDDPVFEAQRGDLCVLDIECYGRLSDGKAADLYSLKNITQNKEINSFGATSVFTAGSLFSGVASVLAYNFETMSFVFKYRNEVSSTDQGYTKKEIHFGVSVYVLNRYKHTFFPDSMAAAQQTSITDKASANARTAMTAEFSSLVLMPLNDLADWTDSRMQRLRERYCRALTKGAAETHGAYSGNPTPYGNPDIGATPRTTANPGYKYWKTGSYDYAAPTSDDYNWYENVVRHGLLRPYILFDLQTPRPGWWQYTGQIIQRCEINPHTTFFTHPNGTWAFFNQSLIYNKNGIHLVTIGDSGLGTSEWDMANMEHCIFDKVHFSVFGDEGVAATIDTTFRELYNQAIVNGQNDGTLTDDSQQIELTDMRITFTPGTIADPYDAGITYAQMQITWPTGFEAYYRELGYFSGAKTGTFDASMIGGSQDLSLATLWKLTPDDGAALSSPDTENAPATFSTCVMITK